MEVLWSVKDKNGRPAKMTLNTCVANPDFKRIKENDFQTYYYEPFTETLNRYPHHNRSFELWTEGIRHHVFQPQFHGREHLNAQMWMDLLRANNPQVREAFKHEVYSMDIDIKVEPRTHVMSAFNVNCKEEYEFVFYSIKEGLSLFEQLFGFRSESMIAPCYTWDAEVEDEALKYGIRIIQGGIAQRSSIYAKTRGMGIKRHYIGQKNTNGQVYLVRTCFFEPTQSTVYNADNCMKEIEMNFRFHKPAVVCTHRLNYIGELNPSNRDKNLREFKRLLKMIITEFPDVEFMSSDELGSLIIKQ